jgi:hypothetical protein
MSFLVSVLKSAALCHSLLLLLLLLLPITRGQDFLR